MTLAILFYTVVGVNVCYECRANARAVKSEIRKAAEERSAQFGFQFLDALGYVGVGTHVRPGGLGKIFCFCGMAEIFQLQQFHKRFPFFL